MHAFNDQGPHRMGMGKVEFHHQAMDAAESEQQRFLVSGSRTQRLLASQVQKIFRDEPISADGQMHKNASVCCRWHGQPARVCQRWLEQRVQP